jgi:hypothetical protein
MECRPEPVEDGDVCYDLYIQGHWKAANLDHDDENDAIKVDVDLQATYVLDGSTFRLLAVDSNDSLRAPSRQSIR